MRFATCSVSDRCHGAVAGRRLTHGRQRGRRARCRGTAREHVAAARKISRWRWRARRFPRRHRHRSAPDTNQDDHVDGLPFGARGSVVARHLFPSTAKCEIKIRLTRGVSESAGCKAARRELALDGHASSSLGSTVAPYARRYYSADTPSLSADEALRLRLAVKAGNREVCDVRGQVVCAWRGHRETPHIRAGRATGCRRLTSPSPGRSAARVERRAGARILRAKPPRRRRVPCAKQIQARSPAGRSRRGRRSAGPRRCSSREATAASRPASAAVWRARVAAIIFRRGGTEGRRVPVGVRISDRELASRLSFFLWAPFPTAC